VLADMHCHYPMHVLARAPKREAPDSPHLTVEAMAELARRPGWLEALRSRVLTFLAEQINHDDEWRVSLDGLVDGDVRAVFSVLYEPFAEFDLDQLPGTGPEPGYFEDLLEQMKKVEDDLAAIDGGRERHEIVATAADLDRVTGAGKVAFMHCVEGGFHLGASAREVRENVARLADLGVVYVTLAHLFWRGVATNAPAIPFLDDDTYRAIFDHEGPALSELGEAAVRAMYEGEILIDISHMDQRAIDATFALLDRLDEESGSDPKDHPVIATHAGYRFRDQEYMLSPETIGRIADRDGVIGLILARHQLYADADVRDPDDPAEAIRVIRRHIDEIRACTPCNTNAHVAIGSDLDGFIKPTVAGIEQAADLGTLVAPLRTAYGADADLILSGNAMRVARKALAGR
jgi:microsomal dipeptidase-like Zn-dependent dipeptidase